MASKTIIMFGMLLVAALLVTSEVAAEQTQANTENKAGTQDYRGGPGYGHGGGPGYGHGGGHGGGPGYGHGGGPGYGHGGGPGYGPGYGHGGRPGPYCRWGCCRSGYRGGCMCCMHANEMPEPMYIPEVQN